MRVRHLDFVEFYITNVCNLSCDGCNRFNNLNLRGHEDWLKHRDDYKIFLDNVECEYIAVLGGEPTMHPMINTVLSDLRSYFPTKTIELVTNGLLLHKVKGLWKTIVEKKIRLDVNVHNIQWRVPIYDNLVKLIGQRFKLHWMNNMGHIAAWFTHNGVKHKFTCSSHYNQNALGDPHGKLTPYQSDREKAWQACNSKCPTIADGKFFKCPVSHCLPVAVRQRNDIEYTNEQKSLIETFPHIQCKDIQNVSVEDFDKLVYKSIAQCSLCPEHYTFHKINHQEISKNYF
jgi:organic radical activating enzyme